MYERNYHNNLLKRNNVVEKKEKRPFRWNIFFWIIGALIFVSGIIYLIKFPQFQIKEVLVKGAVVVEEESISNLVMNDLNGEYLSYLPKTSILLANTNKIQEKIKNKFPRFKNIKVTRNSLDSLIVEVEEYDGKYLWCIDTDCSFMSENATVFAPAPYFSGDAYLKVFVGEKSDYPFVPINESQLEMISNIVDKLRGIAIVVTEFNFVSEYKIDLVFTHNDTSAHIYIDPTKDIDSSLLVLYTGLRTEPLAAMYRDSTKILEYLDLRNSSKVVYKFQ